MPALRPALVLLLLSALVAACGADDGASRADGAGGTGGTTPSPWPLRHGGPLANAGPDQRTLAGLPVHLDSRSSMAGEEGLPIARRWTQEAGPRVMLDDPTAEEAFFIAPPVLSATGTKLVFLLTVDDGQRTSVDRMTVELVDRPVDMLPAPVAVGGPDLQVEPGTAVELQAPFTLDPACLDEGGQAGCEAAGIPTRYVQIEGPPVELRDRRFVAPGYEAVLTFRLDGHRRGDVERLDDCVPGGATQPLAFCSAPDHVRVLVVENAFDRPPAATFRSPVDLPEAGGLYRVRLPDDAVSEPVTIHGATTDPDGEKENLVARYRPLLGSFPGGKLIIGDYQIKLHPDMIQPDGSSSRGWPRTVAVALEARSRRLFSAPAVAAVRWEAPATAPTADAGANPCHAPLCTPFVGGEAVTLDGSASSDPDTDEGELVYCWRQTFGPPVAFEGGDESCMRGEARRTFVAPEAPAGGKALYLAFALTVDDGGPLLSRPDTTLVQIRPPDNQAPEVVVDAPSAVDEGGTARLDASRSRDPEGDSLTFAWRQLATGGPAAELVETSPCLQPGACVEFIAPSVTRDTTLRFEVTVADDTPLYATQLVDVFVHNSNNDPPVADGGGDRVAAPGALVEITGSGLDPNPGDSEALVYRWVVLEGGVVLEEDEGPVARFVAPAVAVDTDILLELSVEDPGGAASSDRVIVTILAEGPYVAAAGDDSAPGTRASPVASPGRGLQIAMAHDLPLVKIGGGSFVEAAELVVEGVELRGGHDDSWFQDHGIETRLVLAEGLALTDGASLSRLAIEAPTLALVVRVLGDAVLREVLVDGSALAAGSVALQVEAGHLLVTGGAIQGALAGGATKGIACIGVATLELRAASVSGGGGAGDHVGIDLTAGCGALLRGTQVRGGSGGSSSVGIQSDGLAPLQIEASFIEAQEAGVRSVGIVIPGALHLTNTILQVGAAPEAAAVIAGGTTRIHSSLLRVEPAQATTHASGLRLAGDAALRNVILDAGGAAANRAHLRLEGGGSASVLARVLFVADPACGGASAYVRAADGTGACSPAGIRGIGPSWDPLVGNPHWRDPAVGDFRLLPASAAIDAGVAEEAPPFDFDGLPRGGDGNGDGTPGFDVGPFERQP